MAILSWTLGSAVRAAREQTGVSLRDCAKALGISAPYLSEIERDIRIPSEALIVRIAGHLMLNKPWLLSLAGRTSDRLKRYVQWHPAYWELAERIAEADLTEAELQTMADGVTRETREERGAGMNLKAAWDLIGDATGKEIKP